MEKNHRIEWPVVRPSLAEIESVREYLKNNPVDFCRVVLGDELKDGQARVLESLKRNPGFHYYDAARGEGKTFLASRAAVWWTFTGGIVLTLAPTVRMNEKILWREINAAFMKARKVVGGKCTSQMEWQVGPANFARGITLNKIQGYSGRILVIIDEAWLFYLNHFPEAYDMKEYLNTLPNVRILELG